MSINRPLEDRVRRTRSRRVRWAVWLLVIVVAGVYFALKANAGTPVQTVKPHWATVAETIAASGTVSGHAESTMGADAQGTVTSLLVDENSIVKRGDLLAVVQPRTAQGQVEQAEMAVARAEAQVRQAQVGALPQEVRAAAARVRDADAGIARAKIALDRARIAIDQTANAIQRAGSALGRARAARSQAVTRRDLARKTLARTRALVTEGALPTSRLDEDQAAMSVAEATVNDSDQAIRVAQDDVSQSHFDETSAQAARKQAASDLVGARALRDAAQADLDRLRSLPRPQDVSVARAQLTEAGAALETARKASQNTEIRAPFDGIVTEILARPGTLSTAGVLRLVDSGHLEVKADVDETNLPRLKVDDRVMLATSDAPDRPVDGRLLKLSSRVDPSKGTVEVVAVPTDPNSRLRPGQRVDLTIVVDPNARRLMVPATAVRRQADITGVFVVVGGRAHLQ
ncbi:MAG TPA: efflux RND transporter periplasmic adaptor subunit, partial [Fimbriimonadaceae bacterium]|nr:efflux RND transporter periplasmic adaptor subunit [Fimbriimonadaceae bacterium]